MTFRSFLVSFAIGYGIAAFGQANDFSGYEILTMAAMGGIIQGAITVALRNRGLKK